MNLPGMMEKDEWKAYQPLNRKKTRAAASNCSVTHVLMAEKIDIKTQL